MILVPPESSLYSFNQSFKLLLSSCGVLDLYEATSHGAEPVVEKGIAFSQEDLDHNTHTSTQFPHYNK